MWPLTRLAKIFWPITNYENSTDWVHGQNILANSSGPNMYFSRLTTGRTEGRSAAFAPVPGGGDLQNNGLPKAGARRALPLCVHFTAPNGTYKPALYGQTRPPASSDPGIFLSK